MYRNESLNHAAANHDDDDSGDSNDNDGCLPSSSLFIFSFCFETGSYCVLAQAAFDSRRSSPLSLPNAGTAQKPPQLAVDLLNSPSPYCALIQRLGRDLLRPGRTFSSLSMLNSTPGGYMLPWSCVG